MGLTAARVVASQKYVLGGGMTIHPLTGASLRSDPSEVQVVLSTAHPAKFSEAVTRALQGSPGFDFEGQVLPPEFKGLLEKERRVIDIDAPQPELVKQVIERFAQEETSATSSARASV